MKKAVLITGGAGFIGSHLCDKLIKKDFKVICLDNFITGSQKNIKHLLNNKSFRLINHDISKPIKIKDSMAYVLHFASPASPVDYLKYPIQTLKVGSLGTHNALGIARVHRAKFLLASTSEVYGDPLEHPQNEKYWGHVNSVGVRSCYDEAKRFAEALVFAYHRAHGIDTKIARIFNTYGERMRINDGRVVPNFIYQALNGQPLTVYGTGEQTRSFCYAADLIEGICRLMLSDANQPVNLGNPDEFTVLEFANLVIELTKTKSRITHKPLPEDDPRQRKPDIARAKKLLGWQPKVKLEQGLLKTITWFKDNL